MKDYLAAWRRGFGIMASSCGSLLFGFLVFAVIMALVVAFS